MTSERQAGQENKSKESREKQRSGFTSRYRGKQAIRHMAGIYTGELMRGNGNRLGCQVQRRETQGGWWTGGELLFHDIYRHG